MKESPAHAAFPEVGGMVPETLRTPEINVFLWKERPATRAETKNNTNGLVQGDLCLLEW